MYDGVVTGEGKRKKGTERGRERESDEDVARLNYLTLNFSSPSKIGSYFNGDLENNSLSF